MQRTEFVMLATAGPARRPAAASRAALRRTSRRRRGIASLLAMLYLVIFSTLALGFYAAVTMASQLAHNDEKALGAQVATESGLAFITYQLSRVRVPGDTPPNQMMQEVLKDLVAQQGKSDNIAGRGIALNGATLSFPAGANEYVPLDGGGAGFRAEITDADDGWLRVRVKGRFRGVTIERQVELFFQSAIDTQQIFDYGIITRGPVNMKGNASVTSGSGTPADASVLSTSSASTPFSLTGSVTMAGDLNTVNEGASISTNGKVSIGGSTNAADWGPHVHRGVPAPEFPAVNTAVFLPYVQTVYKPGLSVYRNCLVPAGTNPTFNGGCTVEGVLYIKYPNQVKFNGGCTVRGTIVVENGATPSSGNSLTFRGGFNQYDMGTLPPSPDFPPGLLELRGSSLLAPGFSVSFGGNAGAVGGTMVANSFDFSGNSGGDIAGTLIGLGNVTLDISGSASLRRSPSTVPIPAGLLFPRKFVPVQQSYAEITH